jgi:hypothetical protein
VNDADKKKLYAAVSTIVNLEAQLTNLGGRGGRAAKLWAETASKSKDEKVKKGLKAASAGLTELLKDAKVVLKDLNALGKDTGNATLLAGHATGKEFRDKVVAKRLASSKAFEQKAAKFTNGVMSILGGNLYPQMSDVDVKVSMASLKNFAHYYNEMRIGLAKV